MFKLKKNKGEKGITLIALIVTIIILIILAGITIGTLTGDNGIIKQAQTAKTETERSDIEEKINVIVIDNSKEREMDKDKLINDFENKLPDGKEIVDSDNLIYIIYPEYSFEVDIETGDVKQTEIERVEDETPWELAGSGTEEDPYLIESIEDLVAFSNSVNNGNNYSSKYVKLTTDLDFNLPFSYDNPKTKVSEKTNRIIEEDSNGTELKTFLTSGTGFNPIGNENTSFTGNFDGNGKEIKNIYINRPEENSVGLFGKILYGNIEKLSVTGKIIGNENTGGIVGRISTNDDFTQRIQYCKSSCEVVGVGYVGGIAGNIQRTKVVGCYNMGNVIGSEYYTGGISGFNTGYVTCSYNIGEIKNNKNYVGGISGNNSNDAGADATIENSYNIGIIKGNLHAGGITGENKRGKNGGIILNSYNKGNIYGNNYVGAVARGTK